MGNPLQEYLDQIPPYIEIECCMDGREALRINNFGNGTTVLQWVFLKPGAQPHSVAVPTSDLRAALDKLEAAEKGAGERG